MITKAESKKNRDRAYRLRKKFSKGHILGREDAAWLSEYERRVLLRQFEKQGQEKKKYKAKPKKLRPPSKKALQAYINAFRRFLSWYGISATKFELKPYGEAVKGIIVTANVTKVEMANIDSSLDYPFDIVAKSLKGHIANVRVKLVSGRFYRWKSLAKLVEVEDVFVRAGIGLVKWARMEFPSSFEYREEYIVIFDSYFRKETPEWRAKQERDGAL